MPWPKLTSFIELKSCSCRVGIRNCENFCSLFPTPCSLFPVPCSL
ncbi:hypothetical protein [Moorena producens]|nr:hypothetical protein [Moorena producens]